MLQAVHEPGAWGLGFWLTGVHCFNRRRWGSLHKTFRNRDTLLRNRVPPAGCISHRSASLICTWGLGSQFGCGLLNPNQRNGGFDHFAMLIIILKRF